MKKILYGICGIGNGHLYRQLPILKYLLSKKYQILVFAYGNSLNYLKNYIQEHNLEEYNLNKLLEVVEVNVPYYIGNSLGIDFIKSSEINKNNDHSINLKAFAFAQNWLGCPDLVISDYEPFCAQYGYSYNSKVITIDQQSKYLLEYLPQPLENTYYNDEIMRLRMFFPLAEKRFVMSFFQMESNESKSHNNNSSYNNYTHNCVKILPPLIREEILSMHNIPDYESKNYIVYISAQEGYQQSIDNILEALSKNRNLGCFHIFLKESQYKIAKNILETLLYDKNKLKIYKHGSKEFEKLLESCLGIITTAGHTLISEAMHLKIPVYALALDLYEQQLSAKIINDNQFGIKLNEITEEGIITFSNNIAKYRYHIINDNTVLFKNSGLNLLIKELSLLL